MFPGCTRPSHPGLFYLLLPPLTHLCLAGINNAELFWLLPQTWLLSFVLHLPFCPECSGHLSLLTCFYPSRPSLGRISSRKPLVVEAPSLLSCPHILFVLHSSIANLFFSSYCIILPKFLNLQLTLCPLLPSVESIELSQSTRLWKCFCFSS